MPALTGHNNQVWEVSWSPDGTLLATGSGYGDSRVNVWNIATGETLLSVKASDYAQIDRLIWSPNGRWLVSDPDYDRSILWEVATGENVSPAQGSFFNNWSPNGTQLALLTEDNIIVWNMLTNQADLTLVREFVDNASSVVWSPDGEKLALVGSGQVTILEVRTNQTIATIEQGANIVAWSPDGRLLAMGSASQVIIVDVIENQIIGDYKGHSDTIEDLAWSQDGRRLASGGNDETVVIWDILDQIHPLTEFTNYDQVAFNRSRSQVAFAAGDKITIHDIEQGKEIAVLTGHPGTVSQIYWDQNDQKLVAIVDETTAVVWDVSTGQIDATITGHEALITQTAWNKDWSQVAIGAADGKIIVWDVANDQRLATFEKHTDPITELMWNEADTWLVSGTKSGTVILWDVVDGQELATIQGPAGELDNLRWSPDEAWLFVSSSQGSDHTTMVWNVEKEQNAITLSGVRNVFVSKTQDQLEAQTSFQNTSVVWDMRQDKPLFTIDAYKIEDWSPDGARLVTSAQSNGATLWDVPARAPITKFSYARSGGNDLAFGLDGKILINETRDALTIRDTANGQVLKQLEGYTFGSISPGGTRMLAGFENKIIVWDLARNEAMTTLSDLSISATQFVWSSDDTKIASAKSLEVWDVTSGEIITNLESMPWEINSVRWYPDETKLIGSASSLGTLTVWDAKTGSKLSTLEGHTRPVNAIAFSPDEKWLATGGDDKAVIVWDLASGQVKYKFEGHIKPVANLAWSPNGDRLVSIDSARGFVNTDHRKAYIWDMVHGKLITEINAPESGGFDYSALRWNSTGHQLAIGNGNILWDMDKNQLVEGPWGDGLTGARWSPDETYLAWMARNEYEITWDMTTSSIISFTPTSRAQVDGTLSSDKTKTVIRLPDEDKIVVRQVEHNEEIASLEGYGNTTQTLAWSPDDSRLALGLSNGEIILWNITGDQPTVTLAGNTTSIRDLDWDSTGNLLISKSRDPDERLIVWDVTSGEAVTTLTGNYNASWSPNETNLILTGDDQITILDTRFVASPCQWISRDLSRKEWEQFFSEEVLPYQRTCPNIPVYPDVIPPLLEEAETLVKEGDTQGGLELLEQAIDLDPSLNFDPQETVKVFKANALFDEAMAALEIGDLDTLIVKVRAAIGVYPRVRQQRSMDMLSIFPTLYQEGVGLIPAGDLEKAVDYIRTVAWLMPESEHSWIYGGLVTAAIESGQLKAVLDIYKQVEKEASSAEAPADLWNSFCWKGSLRGHVEDVLSACERAVELAPDHGGIRDSRGLARALTHDYEGAIDDFEYFIEWASQRRGYESAISERTDWITKLKAGQNPFDEKTLAELQGN
ncbi:MAG: hypothetical protein KDI79_12435 [Anaerolineae bacterium]|nr:hypothetical protein [Anaerolineae bacterium]